MSLRRTLLSCTKQLRRESRAYSTKKLNNSEIISKRNEIFAKEKARQFALVSRIEKIQVDYKGIPEACTLLMNKDLSTPFNCAMHINELTMKRSVLALVNGQPCDMHSPIRGDCTIEFLHFRDEECSLANMAYWRSGSFLLGYVMERAFKDEYDVNLCSFPKPNVRSGSFIYDMDLDLPDWKPSATELNCLSRIGGKLHYEDWKFERLDVDASVALKMFEDNRFKTEQIPSIASQSADGSSVTVYRLQDHVDITRGPLISSTDLLARFTVTAIHDIESPDLGKLKRVQGVSYPKQLPLHSWAYERIEERGRILNNAPIPTTQKDSAPAAVDANGS
jgi:large subunit ribosomal protein L39